MSTIGDRLRQTIQDCGFSVRSFAKQSDLPYRSLQAYVTSEQKPSVDALLKIRMELAVNLDWLLTGSGTQFLQTDAVKARKPTLSDIRELARRFDLNALADFLISLRGEGAAISPQLAGVFEAIESINAPLRKIAESVNEPYEKLNRQIRQPFDAFNRSVGGPLKILSEIEAVSTSVSEAADRLREMVRFLDEALLNGKPISHPDVHGGRPITPVELDQLQLREIAAIYDRMTCGDAAEISVRIKPEASSRTKRKQVR